MVALTDCRKCGASASYSGKSYRKSNINYTKEIVNQILGLEYVTSLENDTLPRGDVNLFGLFGYK